MKYNVFRNGFDSLYELTEKQLFNTLQTITNFGGEIWKINDTYICDLHNGEQHIISPMAEEV